MELCREAGSSIEAVPHQDQIKPGNRQKMSGLRHLEIVGKLFHLLDPNRHLDRWISETFAHMDNQLALCTSKPPVLPSKFDPGPMLPER